MRVAISGATGAIGSAIAKKLSAGHEVFPIARGGRQQTPTDALICAHGTYGRNWQEAVIVNLVYTMTLVADFMLMNNDSGHIVLLGGAGVGGDDVHENAGYAASKAGLVVFAESLSKRAPKASINVVAPGPVKSRMCPDGYSPERCVDLVSTLLDTTPGMLSGRLISARHDQFDGRPITDDLWRLRRVNG